MEQFELDKCILKLTEESDNKSVDDGRTFIAGDNYALKMRFVDHVFDDLVIDQMTFKIILPEGST